MTNVNRAYLVFVYTKCPGIGLFSHTFALYQEISPPFFVQEMGVRVNGIIINSNKIKAIYSPGISNKWRIEAESDHTQQ